MQFLKLEKFVESTNPDTTERVERVYPVYTFFVHMCVVSIIDYYLKQCLLL